uniref:Uncharacterized protein n=1 Tax=Caenorhabditis japonica TaxID=281687 RepID=A0A8R1E280_CAEJA
MNETQKNAAAATNKKWEWKQSKAEEASQETDETPQDNDDYTLSSLTTTWPLHATRRRHRSSQLNTRETQACRHGGFLCMRTACWRLRF